MAITGLSGNSPISADLMYQFYDNKAITPQIRAALQKKQEEADKESGNESSSSSSASKFGPAARVNITDQIIRMNIANGTTKFGKEEEKTSEASDASKAKKPSRYDVLAEVKKSVAEREAKAKAEKDAQLKEIADKVAAEKEGKSEESPPAEG